MNLRFWSYSFFIACLFIFVWGYQFNTGDHAEHLPQVYQHMDPSLYEGDFFLTRYRQTFTVRFYYEWTLYILSYIAPVPAICFVFTLLCLTVTVYSWIQTSLQFSENEWVAYLVPMFIFFLCYRFTIGGNNVTYPVFTCSLIGKTFISLAIWKFIDRKYYVSALMLGIGTLYQAMAGGQVFALLGAVLILNLKQTGFKKPLLFGIIYVSIASFMLVPLFTKQFLVAGYDKELYGQIMYNFRTPIHFLPSFFPVSAYVKYILLLLTGVIFGLKFITSQKRKFIWQFYAIQFTGILIYTIAIESFHVYDVARLQWFKTTIWISAFNALLVAILLVNKLAIGPLIFPKYRLEYIFFAGAVLLLCIMLNSKYLPFEKLKHRFMAGNYEKSDLTFLHEWIRDNMDKKAVFVSSPDDMSFSCEAKRPLAVSTHAMVHEPFFIFDWYRKYEQIYGANLENTGNVPFREMALKNYTTRYTDYCKLNADYRIDDLSMCTFKDSLGELVHQQGNYIITKVSK